MCGARVFIYNIALCFARCVLGLIWKLYLLDPCQISVLTSVGGYLSSIDYMNPYDSGPQGSGGPGGSGGPYGGSEGSPVPEGWGVVLIPNLILI